MVYSFFGSVGINLSYLPLKPNLIGKTSLDFFFSRNTVSFIEISHFEY